ncbi:hypothetical protein Vretimale_18304 [Volvox reticuliferus]|uniref:Uncharacterized protein n=1 Tax=Volvox reticuliferus TaxID=1737510 RepID=A0A8J4GY35_9CHLO|nr:hypothetical protein Vretimale_18304 [Volvox reticuliferus]
MRGQCRDPATTLPGRQHLDASSSSDRELKLWRAEPAHVNGPTLSPGNILRFISTQTSARWSTVSVTCSATSDRYYGSFRAMLEMEGLPWRRVLPGMISLEGVEVSRSIPNYRKREAVEGVVAVGFKILPHQEDAS